MKTSVAGRRRIAVILLLGLLPSCVSYHGATLSELPSGRQQDLRLTMQDRSKLVLLRAVLQADSIHGFEFGQAPARTPRSIAVSDLREVEIRKVERGITAAVVLGTVAAVFIAVMSTISVP